MSGIAAKNMVVLSVMVALAVACLVLLILGTVQLSRGASSAIDPSEDSFDKNVQQANRVIDTWNATARKQFIGTNASAPASAAKKIYVSLATKSTMSSRFSALSLVTSVYSNSSSTNFRIKDMMSVTAYDAYYRLHTYRPAYYTSTIFTTALEPNGAFSVISGSSLVIHLKSNLADPVGYALPVSGVKKGCSSSTKTVSCTCSNSTSGIFGHDGYCEGGRDDTQTTGGGPSSWRSCLRSICMAQHGALTGTLETKLGGSAKSPKITASQSCLTYTRLSSIDIVGGSTAGLSNNQHAAWDAAWKGAKATAESTPSMSCTGSQPVLVTIYSPRSPYIFLLDKEFELGKTPEQLARTGRISLIIGIVLAAIYIAGTIAHIIKLGAGKSPYSMVHDKEIELEHQEDV